MSPLLLLACAWGPGLGYTSLSGATARVALEPGLARGLADGSVMNEDGRYAVSVQRLVVGLQELSLDELQGGGGGGGSFDPADPPDGYSLCHGGHCHADDGSLVSYSEVEAALLGGAASFVPVAGWEAGVELDALAGPTLDLGAPSPSAELPALTLSRGSLGLSSLLLSGEVGPGPAGEDFDPISLSVELPLDATFSDDLGLELGPQGPPELGLEAELLISGELFDGLDFQALAVDGLVLIDDPEAAAGLTLSSNLGTNALQLTPLTPNWEMP